MAAISNRRFILPVLIAFSFATGFFFGLIAKGLLNPSGWAEALSGIATAVALILAVVTYMGWHKQKIREDAYSTKKLYISTLVQIEATTVKIANIILNLVPEAGMLVPSENQARSNLEKVIDEDHELKLNTHSLSSVASELGFWGASLTPDSATDHAKLIDAINEYLRSLHGLHNCLMNIYIHKSSDNTIEQWKERFIRANKEIFDLFNLRKTKSMSTVFLD
ncbi:hypothetical protein KVQ82_09470 [Pseudomonas sp. AO-1]|uniref:hypothetical protein n=1 Tax=Pseudomonas sp. AO-1 TaxID=2855434 RepID=UPI001C74F333|nr:hypothetical protein [Pseudomonas sp. AO-1]QXZ16114.1 hypothetical protein KVQ82_09470 [Pseudomonas sp. AO-1]